MSICKTNNSIYYIINIGLLFHVIGSLLIYCWKGCRVLYSGSVSINRPVYRIMSTLNGLDRFEKTSRTIRNILRIGYLINLILKLRLLFSTSNEIINLLLI